jgi:hypothetical protein
VTPGWKDRTQAVRLDLNIPEPGHQPHYPFFVPFEYDFYRALTGGMA